MTRLQHVFDTAEIDAQIAAVAARHVTDPDTPARLASVAEDAFARLAVALAGPRNDTAGQQR